MEGTRRLGLKGDVTSKKFSVLLRGGRGVREGRGVRGVPGRFYGVGSLGQHSVRESWAALNIHYLYREDGGPGVREDGGPLWTESVGGSKEGGGGGDETSGTEGWTVLLRGGELGEFRDGFTGWVVRGVPGERSRPTMGGTMGKNFEGEYRANQPV